MKAHLGVLVLAALLDTTTIGTSEVSYYSDKFHNRLTASGVRFNARPASETRWTAAVLRHPRTKRPLIPFGTVVRLKRGDSIAHVCVTDTGSHVPRGWNRMNLGGRMWFDLQKPAFRRLAGGSLDLGRMRGVRWTRVSTGSVRTCADRISDAVKKAKK